MLCCAELLWYVRFFATPRSVAHQAPLSMGILQAKILCCIPEAYIVFYSK